jgi:hypothetical protein
VPFRCGVFGGVSGFSVTLQNNRLGWIDIAPDCVELPYISFRAKFHYSCNGGYQVPEVGGSAAESPCLYVLVEMDATPN